MYLQCDREGPHNVLVLLSLLAYLGNPLRTCQRMSFLCAFRLLLVHVLSPFTYCSAFSVAFKAQHVDEKVAQRQTLAVLSGI